MEASLYIHVPFCAHACDYCDFYSISVKPRDPRPERFIETLLLEAERFLRMTPSELETQLSSGLPGFETGSGPSRQTEQASSPYGRDLPFSIPTVFFGGGTPSLLGPAGIKKLLCELMELITRYTSSQPSEITLEANPETADEAFLAAIREAGVTRLSLGIQTFNDPARRAVNRIGDAAMMYSSLSLAKEYFPGAFSVDLMSGLPFQDEKVLLNDIAGVLFYKPVHVSLYALSASLQTPLSAPDQDEADRLWLCGRDALEKSGYSQYEVSNFCLPGMESRHNIRYWLMNNWLGFGPAASGTIINEEKRRGYRYTIPHDVDSWLSSRGCWFSKKHKLAPKIEELDTLTLIKESLLMGFRYLEGPDEELFRRRFRIGIYELIPKTINSWREHGSFRKGKLALTKDGLLFLNRFLLDTFEELDAVFTSW